MSRSEQYYDLIVIGGGAAGFFGAITAAEFGTPKILILEKGPEILTKVRISGGGRCNVTHQCFDPKDLAKNYPRGHRNLIGPFHRWQPADTITWFEDHGVELKTEEDGRMFPTTDDSHTIIDCLTNSANDLGIKWRTHCGVTQLHQSDQTYELFTSTGDHFTARNILVATGGIRSKDARIPAENLNHDLSSPVPSLFTFKISDPRIHGLQGVSVPHATASTETHQSEGPLLITHWGLSGPAILKISAWGARDLSQSNYRFSVTINWTGSESLESVQEMFHQHRRDHGVWKISKRSPIVGISKRLWQRMCETSGILDSSTWSKITKLQSQTLAKELVQAKFSVDGKSLNKDEFVTCGGVSLDDVQLKSMESKEHTGLYFAGEVLDIDGITGGFNFQAAWTTGRLAGMAIAESTSTQSK